MTVRARNYWKTVEACLVEIYGVEPADAASATATVISKLGPVESSGGMLYHDEPLSTAADIVGHYGPVSDELLHRYHQIEARFATPAKAPKRILPAASKPMRKTTVAKVMAGR